VFVGPDGWPAAVSMRGKLPQGFARKTWDKRCGWYRAWCRIESDQPQPMPWSTCRTRKSLEVRTYITEADGHYRFGQLSSEVDYQLWAEYKGHKSKTKSISSFDSKKQFNFDLKIDTSK
jgi:hypothetical protein